MADALAHRKRVGFFADLPIRWKLLTLIALPSAAFAVVFGLLLYSDRISERSYATALEWSNHAQAILEVQFRAQEYLHAVIDGSHDAYLRARSNLERAQQSSLNQSRKFSPDEEAEEQQLATAVSSLILRGEILRAERDPEGVFRLHELFTSTVEPLLEKRVHDEQQGSQRVVAEGERQRTLVRPVAFVLSILSSALTGILLLCAGRYFVRTVDLLEAQTRRVAEGDLGAELPFDTNDELGSLARSFQQMATQLSSTTVHRSELQAALLELKDLNATLDQRVAERTAALIASEERYSLAVRGANDGIFDLDLAAGELHFSPRCREMLGLTLGSRWNSIAEWLAFVVPEDRPRAEYILEEFIRDGAGDLESEWRMLHAEGDVRWIAVRGCAVRSEGGRAVRIAGSMTDTTERRRWEEDLLQATMEDDLTGLGNRRAFLSEVERALARVHRGEKPPFAVLFLDLDRFKLVNDSRGHNFGDELLIQVAGRLHRFLRDSDRVARLGGDEFGILLDNLASPEAALAVADRLSAELRAPLEIRGELVHVSASLGVAMSDSTTTTAQELLQAADIAMYRAKEHGRGRPVMFGHVMSEELAERVALESALRGASKRGELRLVYQPIVDIATCRPVGFEALLRWNLPGKGPISPGKFIPIAEESGLIFELTDWVAGQVCHALSRWQHELEDRCYVSFNLSPKQLMHGELVETISDTLERSNVHSSHLAVEITESSILQGQRAIEALEALQRMGIRVLMDDFGTGYSSLANLLRFDVDVIKIDRTFIAQPGDLSDDFVRAILSLAASLGKKAVAEGVETVEQLERLRRMGADCVQGYYFSRPLEEEAVMPYYRAAISAPERLRAAVGARSSLTLVK